jgi:cyanophycinase
MSAPVALVGSGEYLPVMTPVDASLLAGRPKLAVLVPTAAGLEGDARVNYWLDLGERHFAEMGVDTVALRVLDRDDAEREEMAAEIEGAGLIYLSGGSPAYLCDSLRGTRLWTAILKAVASGTAIAGCSAGACALTALAGGFRRPDEAVQPGLGLLDHLAVIPHFDLFDAREPGLVDKVLARLAGAHTLIGIDEETALVGGPVEFEVWGRHAVWWLAPDGSRTRFEHGDRVAFAPGADPSEL